jgi:hypothetical protein
MTTLSPENVTLATVLPFVAPKLMTKKYVILSLGGIEKAVLFEAPLKHSEVAAHSGANQPPYPIVSAGFYEIHTDLPYPGKVSIEVSGHSHSLGVSSRPEDAEIIRKLLVEDGQ